jgi:hypothetical protein
MSETANWKVVGYGGSGGILTEYTIENRTESEARSEAENDLLIILSDDWTMTKIEDSYENETC